MCEIIYFIYMLTCLARVYMLIRIISCDVDAFVLCKIIFLCVTNLFAVSNHLLSFIDYIVR